MKKRTKKQNRPMVDTFKKGMMFAFGCFVFLIVLNVIGLMLMAI